MILLVGGTGELGGRVVRRLLQRGEQVRCLVRPASDATALRAAGAEVVPGDLVDNESLRRASTGTTVVVATATAMGRQLAGTRRPSMRDIDEWGMAGLIDAAERAAVHRFVYVSYAGIGTGVHTPLERAKLATERRLRATRLRDVIVRPDAFQEVHFAPRARFDLAHNKVATIGRGDTRRRWVSTDDVAALVTEVALEPDPPAVVEFGGPEAITRNEAVGIAEQLTGHAIRHQHMPREVARALARLLDRPNPAMASVFGAGLEQDLHEATWDDAPLRERGITAHPAGQFIEQVASGT